MADEHDIAQVEHVEHALEVAREAFHVVAAPRLVRAAVAAAIERDAAVAARREVGDLVLPHLRREHPAVKEDDRAARADVAHVQPRAVVGVHPAVAASAPAVRAAHRARDVACRVRDTLVEAAVAIGRGRAVRGCLHDPSPSRPSEVAPRSGARAGYRTDRRKSRDGFRLPRG